MSYPFHRGVAMWLGNTGPAGAAGVCIAPRFAEVVFSTMVNSHPPWPITAQRLG